MTDSTLDQVQCLVDKLTPYDQVRLLSYLASRLAQVVPAQPPAVSGPKAGDVWETFFELGEGLAATDAPAYETLTAAVLAMRR